MKKITLFIILTLLLTISVACNKQTTIEEDNIQKEIVIADNQNNLETEENNQDVKEKSGVDSVKTDKTSYDIGNMGFEESFDWKTWVPSEEVIPGNTTTELSHTGESALIMNDKNSVWKEYNFTEADVPQIGSEAIMGAWIFLKETPTKFYGDNKEYYDFVIKLVGYTDDGGIKTIFTQQYLETDSPVNEWIYVETPIGTVTECDRIQFVFENNSGVIVYVDDVIVKKQ